MNPALFVAAVVGAAWGIIGAACAMPWFHEAAWVPAWFGPIAGLVLAQAQTRVAPSRWPAIVAFAVIALTAFAIWIGAASQVVLELAPLVHNAITGEALPVEGGVSGAVARVVAAAMRTGLGVWTSGLALVLTPLVVLTLVLLRRAEGAVAAGG
ncbi:MAG: hypothetical protein U0P30_10105 [Vicinamibacterales bacterium]